MHSPNDTLVRMANDIGKFFRSQGEERGVEGIADHIRKFWEPRMKKQIFAHLDEGGRGTGSAGSQGPAETEDRHARQIHRGRSAGCCCRRSRRLC